MRPPHRLLALLLLVLLVLLGAVLRPAWAMPDQVVRAPAPHRVFGPDAGGLVAGPARARPLAPAPVEPSTTGVWPLDPRPEVVRAFDPPSTAYGRGHRGVDLHGRVGQAVRTSLAGEVTFAGSLAGRGVVVVSHGATRTTYEPVTAGVHRGDHVARGARIGRLEWSGSHCLPATCLHWGLRRGETYLDPLTLVGGGPQPVRLYPW